MPREASSAPSARKSALAIIEAEHAALDGALSWISGRLALSNAHHIAPDPGAFEQGLEFIATFMERFHHPKEDEFLFRALRERTRDADDLLATLQQQHAEIPRDFRDLRLALKGARQDTGSRFPDFAELMGHFARSQGDHMRLEAGVFDMAARVLEPSDWKAIHVAFRANCDPLFGSGRAGLTSIMAKR